MKSRVNKPAPVAMMRVVNEFVDLLHWTLNRILDDEGISMLQWAFMMRAYDCRNGVSFQHILQVTGESKDNVRRAADLLKGFADVVIEPRDRRARRLVLTRRGKRRAGHIIIRFQREVLGLLGARDERSERAREFKSHLWDAYAFLIPSDLASDETIARSEENREQIRDTSLDYVQDDTLESMWIPDDSPDDWFPY